MRRLVYLQKGDGLQRLHLVRHTADVTLAAALQSALHSFAKPWYRLRALHIFRDQTNLAVNPALWSSIREAIDQSLFFILLASPEAAASPWVAKEAEYWIGRNGTARVLIVLTGGTLKWDHLAASFTAEHSNALPPGLLHAFPEEPLFLDLRWTRDGSARLNMREPRFHEAVLQLAATLHNRPKDELDGADIENRRRTRRLVASVLISLLLIALFALYQFRVSHKESVQNLAASLATSSAKVLADSPDRAREAALLAIESNRLYPSFEANQALRGAVSLLPASEQLYAPDPGAAERVRDLAFSPDAPRSPLRAMTVPPSSLMLRTTNLSDSLSRTNSPLPTLTLPATLKIFRRTTIRPFPWPSTPPARCLPPAPAMASLMSGPCPAGAKRCASSTLLLSPNWHSIPMPINL